MTDIFNAIVLTLNGLNARFEADIHEAMGLISNNMPIEPMASAPFLPAEPMPDDSLTQTLAQL